MSDDTQQPIIVKKIKKGGGGAHGGAWKIAYADFVTAMMAFFLLMWLLGSTAEGDLKGIAEFFENPLKVAQQGGSGSGDSSSVIQGGGRDLTRQTGQVKYGTVEAKQRSFNLTASQEQQKTEKESAERAERAKLVELKSQIEARIEANPDLRRSATSWYSMSRQKACASRSSTNRTVRCSRPPATDFSPTPRSSCARSDSS
jgi:chemotaxis protein MotB